MEIFEAAEVYPTRTVQQEDEEQANATASSNLRAPVILWNNALRQLLYPHGIKPACLVIATSKVSCSLLNNVVPEKQVLGTCVLPEVQMRSNHVQHSLRDRTCFIYGIGDQCQLIVVCCQYDLQPERSVAFAKGLLSELQPNHVLVLGSVAAEQLRSGDSDPSQEPLLYLLSTNASKQSCGQQPLPYLPTGSIASGLPAAVLSHCQARGMSAELLVNVEMVPSLLPLVVQPLASAASALVSRRGDGLEPLQAVARALLAPSCLKAASLELQKAYGATMQALDSVFS